MNQQSNVPTEAQEGKTLAAYFRMRDFMFTHIANETGSGQIAKFQGIRNKQQGTSKGFPDYIVIANDTVHVVELKRSKGGKVSAEQKAWIVAFSEAGIDAFISHGAKDAIDYFEEIYPRSVKQDF